MKKKCKNCEYAKNVEFGGELLLYVKDKEIERLNNIINEYENYMFGQLQLYGGGGMVQEYYDKLKELKGETNDSRYFIYNNRN